MGKDFRPGLIGSAMCVSCHNDASKFKGRVLGIPHGGTVGYPAKDGKWDWAGLSETSWKNKELADTASKYTPIEQFHISARIGQRGRPNQLH